MGGGVARATIIIAPQWILFHLLFVHLKTSNLLKKSADYRRNYWLFLGHCRLSISFRFWGMVSYDYSPIHNTLLFLVLSLQYSNPLSDFQLNDISKDFHVRFRSLCIQKSDLKLYPLTVHRVKMSSEFSLKRLKSFTMYLLPINLNETKPNLQNSKLVS